MREPVDRQSIQRIRARSVRASVRARRKRSGPRDATGQHSHPGPAGADVVVEVEDVVGS